MFKFHRFNIYIEAKNKEDAVKEFNDMLKYLYAKGELVIR